MSEVSVRLDDRRRNVQEDLVLFAGPLFVREDEHGAMVPEIGWGLSEPDPERRPTR